jgi:hypothetical protein
MTKTLETSAIKVIRRSAANRTLSQKKSGSSLLILSVETPRNIHADRFPQKTAPSHQTRILFSTVAAF